MTGFHLQRTDDRSAEIDALAARVGGRVGLEGVLADLDETGRRGRRAVAPGLAVRRAFTFDAVDRADRRWWPQGVSTSADASPDEEVAGRRLVAVAWYAKQMPDDTHHGGGNQGSRITFYDVATRRYRHVLLVVPTTTDGVAGLEPLRVHAGGIVWHGPWLHVAATAQGFFTCHLDDVLRVVSSEPDLATYGYDHVLPARLTHRARTDEGEERLRYSFLSLDAASTPPAIVAGEYARGTKTRRLARFDLDPDTRLLAADAQGRSFPSYVDTGVAGMQGAVVARGRWHVTTSHGPWKPGSVHVGRPGALVRHAYATPMGPEDITYMPSTDELWSVTEHPRRRWIYAMRRARFD